MVELARANKIKVILTSVFKIQKLAKKPEEKKGWHIRGMRQKVEGEKK